MSASEQALDDLVRSGTRGVLVTLRRDGRPQLSNVEYQYDRDGPALVVSTTEDRAKTRNLRRDPRASFYVTNGDLSAYAVVDGIAQLSPVAAAVGDATTDALVEHYRAVRGEHPDWAQFRVAMVDQRRLLVRVGIAHRYGYAPAG